MACLLTKPGTEAVARHAGSRPTPARRCSTGGRLPGKCSAALSGDTARASCALCFGARTSALQQQVLLHGILRPRSPAAAAQVAPQRVRAQLACRAGSSPLEMRADAAR